ncbi:MAG TPA: hypothetical protein VML55_26005 [Planctomycetaceae bacterium]|nr:hypothetical protein [Planctomycetaceae bacterium]
MRRWLRVVLPGSEVLAIFLGVYALFEAFYWFERVVLGAVPGQELTRIRDLVVLAAAVHYGLARVTRFHPLYDNSYREWLEKTPWTAARPLPVGPVHLVPQDAIVVLGLTLMTLPRLASHPAMVPLGFLCGYLAAQALSLWPTGAKPFAYAVAFGLGLVVRFWSMPLVALGIAAALYVPAYLGLRHSLRRFPWDVPGFFRLSWWKSLQNPTGEHDLQGPRQQILGWPYDRLTPRPDPPSISGLDASLISLLAGWWIYAIAAFFIDAAGAAAQPQVFVWWLVPVSFGLLAIGAGIRSTLYCWAHKPPISVWGRIRTFRWIIPGYDRAVMAPAAALVLPQVALLIAALVLPHGLVSPAVLCALPVTIGLLILLSGQPPLRRWLLTGQHRIVPGYTKNKTLPALTGDYFDEVIEI